MSSLIFNPSNVGNGSVTLNIFGDDKQYNINLPKTNATLIGSVNGKSANENGSVTIDVGVKTVNGVTPDSNGNVTVKVQSIASNSDVISGTDNTKMMTPLRTKESVQQFSPNDYVINLSVSGQTVTFNKKDGTSGSIITQDTKYTHPNSGVKAGTYNSVTVNAQGHVTNGSNVNYVKSLNGSVPDSNGNVDVKVGLAEDDVKNIVLNTFFPVGSTYISANINFNPNTQFGGTWSKIENRFLLGSGSRGVGATGGEEYVTLNQNQMPSHSHGLGSNNITGDTGHAKGTNYNSSTGNVSGVFYVGSASSRYSTRNGYGDASALLFSANRSWTGTISLTGGGQAHNNMPPYEVVNIWKRTA